MDLRKIKTLIELVEESGIAELEVKEGEESVRISRQPTGMPMPMQYFAPQMMAPARPPPPRGACRPRRPAGASRAQGGQPPHHQGADGRHLLPLALARRQGL